MRFTNSALMGLGSLLLMSASLSFCESPRPRQTNIADSFASLLSDEYQLYPILPALGPNAKGGSLSPGGIISKTVFSKTLNGTEFLNLANAEYCAPAEDDHSGLQAVEALQTTVQSPQLLGIPTLQEMTLEVIEPTVRSAPSDVRAEREKSAARRCSLPENDSQVISYALFGKIGAVFRFSELPSEAATKILLEQFSSAAGADFETTFTPERRELAFMTKSDRALGIILRPRQF